MNPSLFLQLISRYFQLVVGKITERFNGLPQEQQMFHKTMLTEEYSADMSWGCTQLNHSIVAADIVSLDSSLPLKSRSSIESASGTLPKIGVKMRKGEKLISDVNVMRGRGVRESEIVSKIFDDVPRVIKAVDVRNEILFLQGLSTGMSLVEDGNVGIRANFGYKDSHKFKTTSGAWTGTGATPLDDLEQIFDKAKKDGVVLSHIYISKKYYNLLRKSQQGKLLAATFAGMVITDQTLLPVPGNASFLDALKDEFGATFHIMDSSFRIEGKDGKYTTVNPWEEANIVATPSENVGRLVYGTLAEETNPVSNVSYSKSGTYTLVSKYSKTDPLEEFTCAQAICLPVIDNADSIYLLTANK